MRPDTVMDATVTPRARELQAPTIAAVVATPSTPATSRNSRRLIGWPAITPDEGALAMKNASAQEDGERRAKRTGQAGNRVTSFFSPNHAITTKYSDRCPRRASFWGSPEFHSGTRAAAWRVPDRGSV